MKLIQQNTGCSDVDVIFSGQDAPSFRMLLPESILLGETSALRHTHIIPGAWESESDSLFGSFYPSKDIQVSVELRPDDARCRITLGVTNRSSSSLRGIRANTSLSLNRLPGSPAWSNQAFLPDQPLDRAAQGRYWYERVAPRAMRVLANDGWLPAHASPDNPDPDETELYHLHPHDHTVVSACAVVSNNSDRLLYQWWQVPCHYLSPFPGNASMVLLPVIAEKLVPGESAEIRGVMGLFEGTWDALAAALRKGRSL